MNPLLFSTVCGFPEQQHYSATTRAFTGFIDASKSYSHSEGCDSVSGTNLPTRESDLWDQEHISGSQPHRQLVEAFVEHVVAGLQDGSYALESVLDGVGGSFFVIGTRNKHIAIFKPSTYEVGMQNNPKGHVEEDKAGFLPGKGYLREVAAYALDHQGFARVPVTAVATIFNEIGSLQRFVPHDGDGSYGSKRFITEDIHRIGILDLRLLNCDRHEGNLLYKQVESTACTSRHVFPIDHGYCLPMDDGLQHLEFDWLYYAQAQIPFSSETLLYIDTLNPGEDASVLRNMGFSRGEIELMMAACFALKYGALKKKLTLRYLGDFFRRTQITQPSGFECVVAHCRRGLSIPDNNGNRDVTFINWSEFHPELMSHLDAYSEKVRDCSFGDGTWNHESGASFAVHI